MGGEGPRPSPPLNPPAHVDVFFFSAAAAAAAAVAEVAAANFAVAVAAAGKFLGLFRQFYSDLEGGEGGVNNQ